MVPEVAEVFSRGELELLGFVNAWMNKPDFHRLSVGSFLLGVMPDGAYTLMAELDGGRIWWVLAYLSGSDAKDIVSQFPKWDRDK